MNSDIYEIKPLTEMHRATIIDVHDPERSGRVRIRCVAIHGTEGESGWCPVSLPPYFYTSLYEGRACWVTFRNGDPNYPIVMGMAMRGDGKFTSPLYRQWTEGPYKEEQNDAVEHAADVFDHEDHKVSTGHGHPPYYDPYMHLFHFPSGAGFGVNEEPGEQGTFWFDRIGNGFRMVGDPVTPLDPHKETRIGGNFGAQELDDGSTLYTEEGWRSLMELYGTHKQRLTFRVKDRDGEEEIELVNTNPREDNQGKLTLSNLLKRNELIRTSPGKELGFEQVLDPRNTQKASTRIWDWHGSEFFMDSAPGKQKIRISVPGGEATTWDNVKGEWYTKDRSGNDQKFSRSGIDINASMDYKLKANMNINMKANLNAEIKANINFKAEGSINADVKGGVMATLEAGVMAKVKAPMVHLGQVATMPVAYAGSLVTTPIGPGVVTLGSFTVLTSP